jgi:hypothetical protein
LEVTTALAPGSDGWRTLFPGRYVLEKFSVAFRLGDWPALQNVLIDELAQRQPLLNPELRDIVTAILASQ